MNFKTKTMKTKLKDFILYSLAVVGAVSLFINATKMSQDMSGVVKQLENIDNKLQNMNSILRNM
tara:strand:+ start:800 stop:991 length:192 start_codon:yes stop_codon:yes gene_type:complete